MKAFICGLLFAAACTGVGAKGGVIPQPIDCDSSNVSRSVDINTTLFSADPHSGGSIRDSSGGGGFLDDDMPDLPGRPAFQNTDHISLIHSACSTR